VERSFAWLSRNRRLAKDYERRVQTSETLIEVAMIRLLLARLGQRAERHANQAVRNGRESVACLSPPTVTTPGGVALTPSIQ
jgi:hypothetical protein